MPAPKRRRVHSARLAAIALCLMAPGHTLLASDSQENPRHTGLVEKAGVTLVLLDVEATDSKGAPLRGLTKKDFVVRLDGKLWPVYSVDDSCACAGSGESPPGAPVAGGPASAGPVSGGLVTAPRESGAPTPEPPGPPGGSPAGPVKFIIYIDFSQLHFAGRLRVRKEVTRWIRETMRPGDEVMIVGYTTATGIREIASLTRHKEALLSALDVAFSGSTFLEDYPELLEIRVDDCHHYPFLCQPYAMEEYFHGRRSLRALRRFLEGLDNVPGRKALLYFHENEAMHPGVFYSRSTPDQLPAIEEAAAAATGARTAIYPVSVGMLPAMMGTGSVSEKMDRQVLDMAAPLAEYTGGAYNRGPADRSSMIDHAGRGCGCFYRIGLEPPAKESRRIYPVSVEAAGIRLPYTYRVAFPTEAERWMRQAQDVLRHPGEAKAIEVGAAIVPVTAGDSWNITVEVVFSSDDLALIPDAAGREARYEVGALLHTLDGARSWEMMGEYKVTRGAHGTTDRVALHRADLAGVPPGSYRLAAFVRDQAVNLFGGAEAVVDLPGTEGGHTGPVVMLDSRRQIVAPLPVVKGPSGRTPPAATSAEGPIPAGGTPIPRGEHLSLQTWICPAGGTAPSGALRFVARAGTPVFRFEGAEPERAGACLHFVDPLDTSVLRAGRYEYHLLWRGESGDVRDDASATFEIREPAPAAGEAAGTAPPL